MRDVIFVDRKLEGENGAIVVGDSGLRNNTGFTGINEATGTTIQDGKELTLIGGKSDGTGNRFTLAERIISAVGDGAKLILGSLELKTLLSTKDRPNRFISLIRENLRLPPAITSSRTLILQAERPLSIKMLFSTAKTLPSQTKQS